MTPTAKYILSTNELQELPPPKPEQPKGSDFHEWAEHVQVRLKEYNAHLASLRRIPCHSSCKELWKDGQELECGKDYEVVAPLVAIAITPKSEDVDELWMEIINKIPVSLLYSWKIDVIDELKENYNITRK